MPDPLPWTYDDGGRAAAGFKGTAGDCAVRAIAIAAGEPYRDTYDELYHRIREAAALAWARTQRQVAAWRDSSPPTVRSPRHGVPKPVIHAYLTDRRFTWHPTMAIGSGTRVHLAAGELPAGVLVARCSRHVVAVVDGVARDTHDPSRGGTRAVYGYWLAP